MCVCVYVFNTRYTKRQLALLSLPLAAPHCTVQVKIGELRYLGWAGGDYAEHQRWDKVF